MTPEDVASFARVMMECGIVRLQVGDAVIDRPYRPEPARIDEKPPSLDEQAWLAAQPPDVQDAVIKYGRWPANSPRHNGARR